MTVHPFIEAESMVVTASSVRVNCCIHTVRSTDRAGTSHSHAGAVRAYAGFEELISVGGDLLSEPISLGPVSRQTVCVGPYPATLLPRRIHPAHEPVRDRNGQRFQRSAQGLPTNFSRFRLRTAASTWVQSVRCRPLAATRSSPLSRSNSKSKMLFSSPCSNSRCWNPDSMVKAKPESDSSSPSRYFTSILERTACAADDRSGSRRTSAR